MDIKINITWDEEASVYIAVCDEIGLALESESYDNLIKRVMDAVPELIEFNKKFAPTQRYKCGVTTIVVV